MKAESKLKACSYQSWAWLNEFLKDLFVPRIQLLHSDIWDRNRSTLPYRRVRTLLGDEITVIVRSIWTWPASKASWGQSEAAQVLPSSTLLENYFSLPNAAETLLSQSPESKL